MIIKQLNRSDAEEVFVTVQNTAGETVSTGVFLCWDHRNTNSLGNAVTKATTSGIGLFAGVNAHKQPSYADLPANSYGLLQVFGVHGSCTYNVAGTSLSAVGLPLYPISGQYSGQNTDNLLTGLTLDFATQNLILARGAWLLSNELSGSGWAPAFVRAL